MHDFVFYFEAQNLFIFEKPLLNLKTIRIGIYILFNWREGFRNLSVFWLKIDYIKASKLIFKDFISNKKKCKLQRRGSTFF